MRGHKKLFPLYRANQRSSLDIVSGAFEDGQQIIETSRIDCNTQRPCKPFGGLAPAVCANLNRATRLASLELRQAGHDRNPVTRKTQERILHPNGPDHGAGSNALRSHLALRTFATTTDQRSLRMGKVQNRTCCSVLEVCWCSTPPYCRKPEPHFAECRRPGTTRAGYPARAQAISVCNKSTGPVS